MDITFPPHMIFWITVVYIPVASTLFWLIWRSRKDVEMELDKVQHLLETRHSQLRDSLSAYKLEVAKTYSTQNDLRNLEGRLVGHLLRIESKLDKQVERSMKGN
jgi:hypothetical protein